MSLLTVEIEGSVRAKRLAVDCRAPTAALLGAFAVSAAVEVFWEGSFENVTVVRFEQICLDRSRLAGASLILSQVCSDGVQCNCAGARFTRTAGSWA